MDSSLVEEIRKLPGMCVPRLLERYQELFGYASCASHKEHLVRRITWKLQATVHGDLSDRARKRSAEIVCISDIRTQGRKGSIPIRSSVLGSSQDLRLPEPGSELRRRVGDREVVVKVLPTGFEYNQRLYRSLSAIAREITGTRWNGLLFFGLTERRRE
jgi:hypothetical protein